MGYPQRKSARLSARALAHVCAVVTTLVISGEAFAHARLRTPTPRTNDDNLKDGVGGAPCGGKPRTGTPARYTMGQTITVQWEETINHAGCFIIKLSPANDQNFTMLANPPHSTTGGVPRQYSAQVKLPDGMTCNACTLQLIQVMNNTVPCPVVNIPAGDSYYSCADVQIVAPPPPDAGTGGSGGGSAGGAGGGGGGGSGGGDVAQGGGSGTAGGMAAGTGGGSEPVGTGGGSAGGGAPSQEMDGLSGGGLAEGGCSSAGAFSAVALMALAGALRRRRSRR